MWTNRWCPKRTEDGSRKLWTDEDGVLYVGVIPFLLEDVVAEVMG